MSIFQQKRYLSDIIYGVFVIGKKCPMLTFATEDEAEEFRWHSRYYKPEQLETVPLSEVLRFSPDFKWPEST